MIKGALAVAFVVLVLFQGVYASSGPTSMQDLMQNIPLLRNKFYVGDLARILVYLDVAVMLIGLGMMLVGRAAGGERLEAAGMYSKGKKMVVVAVIVLPILAALPTLVKFLLNVGTPSSGLADDVPTWG
jgi:hypothetical protein